MRVNIPKRNIQMFDRTAILYLLSNYLSIFSKVVTYLFIQLKLKWFNDGRRTVYVENVEYKLILYTYKILFY